MSSVALSASQKLCVVRVLSRSMLSWTGATLRRLAHYGQVRQIFTEIVHHAKDTFELVDIRWCSELPDCSHLCWIRPHACGIDHLAQEVEMLLSELTLFLLSLSPVDSTLSRTFWRYTSLLQFSLWNEHIESLFTHYTRISPSIDLKLNRSCTQEKLHSPLITHVCIHWSKKVFTLLICLCYFTRHFGFALAPPMSVPAAFVASWIASRASLWILVLRFPTPAALPLVLHLSPSLGVALPFYILRPAPLIQMLWLPWPLLPAHWFACSLSLTGKQTV